MKPLTLYAIALITLSLAACAAPEKPPRVYKVDELYGTEQDPYRNWKPPPSRTDAEVIEIVCRGAALCIVEFDGGSSWALE